MKLRVGYELSYECPQPTPMMLMLMLHTHFSHARDIVVADILVTDPPLPISQYRDSFGNLCSRTVAPIGRVSFIRPPSSTYPMSWKPGPPAVEAIQSSNCPTRR